MAAKRPQTRCNFHAVDSITNEETLKYVLAHELTHYRHLDQVWALLRIVCLSVYWFNPLVWVAAWLSRVDCEQACDESVVKQVGDGSRIDYGRTIVNLISAKPSPDMIICTATTMAAGKNSIKKRISAIAANRKTVVSALISISLLVLFAAACTFTGASQEKPWKWASGVNPNTLYSAEAWCYDEALGDNNMYALSHDENQQLAHLICALDEENFTENQELTGGTPEYEITFTVDSKQYSICQSIAPAGNLEIKYEGKMWWIDSEELNTFILNMLGSISADESNYSDTNEWSDKDVARWESEVSLVDFSIPINAYSNYEEIGYTWAEEFVKQYIENTSEDSPLHSTNAAVLPMEIYAESVINYPKTIIYNMRFVCEASNAKEFERWYVGWAGPLSSAEYPEYEGWMEFGWFIVLENNQRDGRWLCTNAGTGGYGGWGYLNFDNASDFDYYMERLDSGDDSDMPNLMSVLPFVNWGNFDAKWGANGWNILWQKLDEYCLTEGQVYGPEETRMWSDVYPDDQAYRNLYVMLTALNTDGAYTEGIADVLVKQKNYNSEIFDYCLDQLSEEQRDTINMLIEYAS